MLCFCIVRASDSVGSTVNPQAAYQQRIQRVVYEFKRCPNWINLEAGEVELRAGVVRLYYGIIQFNPEVVRDAVKEYISEKTLDPYEQLDREMSLYAFFRVYFAVPSGLLPNAKSFSGFVRPIPDGKFDNLWPLSEAEDGKLVLSGVCGSYRGPPYRVLEEFDYLLETFGRRKMKALGAIRKVGF